MLTNASITYRYANGSFAQIYVHFDGYLDHTGKMLNTHYTDPAKVAKLIKLGSLSSIGPEIGTKHDFEERIIEECNAYGRDRGERCQSAELFKNFEEFVDEGDHQQYNYLFQDGSWYVANSFGALEDFKPLGEMIKGTCYVN